MKFVDEVTIDVKAGNGGNGACSFLRLKFMPFGGPDGGNGGDGGSVYLRSDNSINTLVDYRYIKSYLAQNGEKGAGRDCTGRDGEDLYLRVPVGTVVYDSDTDELIADLQHEGQVACVAQGGRHGVGNAQFKSSVNRSPRKTIPGQEGESRTLRLELKVLADVGLLGLPNAGKSTLISAISSATPKIADYPFTTLYPQLGVVKVGPFKHFVVADLPGLIEGASQGAGLGFRFLKHVSRTRLLFHVLDAFPIDGSDPVLQFKLIEEELAQYDAELLNKERWLLINKIDLCDPYEVQSFCEELVHRIGWKGRYFPISGVAKQGLTELTQQAMQFLDTLSEEADADEASSS